MLTDVVVFPVPPLWLNTASFFGAASFFSVCVTRGPDAGGAAMGAGAGVGVGANAIGAGAGVAAYVGAGATATGGAFMLPRRRPPASCRSCPRQPSEQA